MRITTQKGGVTATIPEWLRSPDVLGILRAATSAGLQRREQDQQAQQFQQRQALAAQDQASSDAASAAKLKLSYDSLAQDAQARQQEMGLRKDQIAAADRLRATQQDSLMQYRRQQIQAAKDRLAETDKQHNAAMTLAQKRLDDAEKKQEALEKAKTVKENTLTPAQKLRALTDAGNMMKLGTTEGPNDASFQSRTNLAGQLMRAFPVESLGGANPPAAKQYQKGQRAKQDGKTYEFDGTTWNEVKE